MDEALDGLTDKEKETLRLIVRGHDAKSAANALDLSVHTINERLRNARRKLDVTSSREAARLLFEDERQAYENSAYKALGDAQPGLPGAGPVAATRAGWRAKRGFAFIAAGVLIMSFVLTALLLGGSPLAPQMNSASETLSAESSDHLSEEAIARAAESFLELIDESRWEDSYAATGAQFRQLNTLEAWTEVSMKVREPLGKNLTRDLITSEFVPAPPKGVHLVKFASSYADGTNQVETVTLTWEENAWKVVGIVIG